MYTPMYPGYTSRENVFLTILALIVIIIFGGAIYAFIYAIFLFIFSKGDENKIKKAGNSIRYAILGIILMIFLLFVFPIIFKKLHIPGYKIYTAENIFKKATFIIKKFFKEVEKSGNSNFNEDYDTSL